MDLENYNIHEQNQSDEKVLSERSAPGLWQFSHGVVDSVFLFGKDLVTESVAFFFFGQTPNLLLDEGDPYLYSFTLGWVSFLYRDWAIHFVCV